MITVIGKELTDHPGDPPMTLQNFMIQALTSLSLLTLLACDPKSSEQTANVGKKSGADAVATCTVTVDGKKKQGKSKAECDKLKADASNKDESDKAEDSKDKEDDDNDNDADDKESGDEESKDKDSDKLPEIKLPDGSKNNQATCKFDIDGVLKEGKTAEECAKLAEELVGSLDLPTNPNTPSTPGNAPSSCSY
ncbi:MAG: hypothetical protein EOP10_16160, partial [Proteobacteria bacterium]